MQQPPFSSKSDFYREREKGFLTRKLNTCHPFGFTMMSIIAFIPYKIFIYLAKSKIVTDLATVAETCDALEVCPRTEPGDQLPSWIRLAGPGMR